MDVIDGGGERDVLQLCNQRVEVNACVYVVCVCVCVLRVVV